MRARVRAACRWWPFPLLAYDVAIAWAASRWAIVARVLITELSIATAAWYYAYFFQRRARLRAEQLGERARQQGVEPYPVCQHYACDGVDCITCEGPCRPPRSVDHSHDWQPWPDRPGHVFCTNCPAFMRVWSN